jgi:Pyruvate/2-oxoacid:ferredoxin oxidoreductase gamma subunit
VPSPFLSDTWLAEAKAIRDKYASQTTAAPPKIKMNQVITNVPFGDGDISLHMDTSNGEMVMEKGHLPDPEVTVITDYETAKAIFVDQNPQAGMQAFMQGKIKVQGDMTKLMAMQAGAPDEIARKIAEEIQGITH